MKIAMELRRVEIEIEGNEAHIINTEGKRLIMVKLPLPEGLQQPELHDYVQKQAMLIREFLKDDPMIMVVPMRPGDICELGVVSPSLEDMKECIQALSIEDRQQLVHEYGGRWHLDRWEEMYDVLGLSGEGRHPVFEGGVMKQVKCANCGRTEKVERIPDIQARSWTPFQRQRARWFYVPGQNVVLCGGSLRTDGIDDGHDWCLHSYRENHRDDWRRVETIDLFMPCIGKVPPEVEAHLEDVPPDVEAHLEDVDE